MWQVTRFNGDKARDGRMGWLRRHSKKVAGIEPCAKGNCLWTPYLSRSLREPAGYLAGSKDWRDITRSAWESLLQYVDQLVLEEVTEDDPCALEPATWGGKMDLAGARKRGLYPIGCTGTLNDGFATASVCTVDGVWRCAPIATLKPARARSTLNAAVAAGGTR